MAARAAGADGKEAQERVLQQVQASAAVIDGMMAEIAREMFLGAAVSHVTESPEDGGSPAQVVAQVVGQRLDQLDSSFLATLDAYIQGAGDKGTADVAEVLLMVRDEVLRALGQRLPPEMQLLEAALSAPDSKGRLALLRQYAALSPEQLPERSEEAAAGPQQGREQEQQAGQQPEAEVQGQADQQQGQQAGQAGQEQGQVGGGGASMHCLAADLERAASQVISDMELMIEVPDRRLLAKLVLLREEVQQMLTEAAFLGSSSGGSGSALSPAEAAAMQLPFRQLGAVPRSCAIFLQRLLSLPGPAERRALLQHALQADREGLPEVGPGPDATNFEKLRAEAEKPQEWVRPGRFLQSLNAMQQEMLEGSAAEGEGGESGGGAAGVADAAVLERVESVRREALMVLLDMAGEGQPYLP